MISEEAHYITSDIDSKTFILYIMAAQLHVGMPFTISSCITIGVAAVHNANDHGRKPGVMANWYVMVVQLEMVMCI